MFRKKLKRRYCHFAHRQYFELAIILNQPHRSSTKVDAYHGAIRIEGNREWLKEAGPGANQGGSNPTRVVRGMSIQIAYVLIDICCVFLNGANAFRCFSGINFHHILAVETLFSVYQPLNRYGAFCLLYAG